MTRIFQDSIPARRTWARPPDPFDPAAGSCLVRQRFGQSCSPGADALAEHARAQGRRHGVKGQAHRQVVQVSKPFCLGEDPSHDSHNSYQAEQQQQDPGDSQYDSHREPPSKQKPRCAGTSGPDRFHDQPQGQHRKQAVEQVSRPHLGAQARDLATEHVRHQVYNSDQTDEPGDKGANPPPHLPHLPVIKRVSLCLWFPRGPDRPAARSEAAWDGPSPPRTRRHPVAGARPARPAALGRCKPRRAVARLPS
jgi:hypothetical protein